MDILSHFGGAAELDTLEPDTLKKWIAKNEEVEQAWVQEVKDRMKSVQDGKTMLLDFEALYDEAKH